MKPTWQTLSHEICGHFFSYVTTGYLGSRSETDQPYGHNFAIEGGNWVASEKGVAEEDLRGLDVNPATLKDIPGHRGESFLRATISGFANGSATLPPGADQVIEEAALTIEAIKDVLPILYVQVEGTAYEGEGGESLATSRAEVVEDAAKDAIADQGMNPFLVMKWQNLFPQIHARFRPIQTQEIPGDPPSTQLPLWAHSLKRVHLYLFHRLHSAGP